MICLTYLYTTYTYILHNVSYEAFDRWQETDDTRMEKSMERHTGDRTYTVYTISMTCTCMYMIRVCSCLHTWVKKCMVGFINA